MDEKTSSLAFNIKKLNLYIIVIGGRLKKTNIEFHDIKWAVGENIQDTFKRLKIECYEHLISIHIDSYTRLKYLDGYEIEIKNYGSEDNKLEYSDKFIWFVNLGGYKESCLMEQHAFTFIVCKTRSLAIETAKSKILKEVDKKHKDNIHKIDQIKYIFKAQGRSRTIKLQIKLRKDKKRRSQDLEADWNGYMPILIK